ncbi:hypothetical protein [Massilia sp. YMA4]|uniref:hypothetical protein n=1 Tax=Massilia sp. YMA4 TaxID=1593482 RepID=UPI0015813D2B|nr:hypothetical protein [Massilia sp. YMA4]
MQNASKSADRTGSQVTRWRCEFHRQALPAQLMSYIFSRAAIWCNRTRIWRNNGSQVAEIAGLFYFFTMAPVALSLND